MNKDLYHILIKELKASYEDKIKQLEEDKNCLLNFILDTDAEYEVDGIADSVDYSKKLKELVYKKKLDCYSYDNANKRLEEIATDAYEMGESRRHRLRKYYRILGDKLCTKEEFDQYMTKFMKKN